MFHITFISRKKVNLHQQYPIFWHNTLGIPKITGRRAEGEYVVISSLECKCGLLPFPVSHQLLPIENDTVDQRNYGHHFLCMCLLLEIKTGSNFANLSNDHVGGLVDINDQVVLYFN